MHLELDAHEASELGHLLTGALSELSSEIADTDNALYARELVSRRETLEAVLHRLTTPGA